MGGASKEAAAVKKVEEQVGLMQVHLQSHGTDIQEMKLTMDSLLQGQDRTNQRQDELQSTLDKVLEKLETVTGTPGGKPKHRWFSQATILLLDLQQTRTRESRVL